MAAAAASSSHHPVTPSTTPTSRLSSTPPRARLRSRFHSAGATSRSRSPRPLRRLPLLLSLLTALRLLPSAPPRPFYALIKSYASLAAAALALARSAGYAPSVPAYNAVLLALSDASLPSARRFLASMLCDGVAPNVHTYNILVRALCARGRREEALDVVGDMRGAGCAPTAITYNTLVAAFCRAGDVGGA